MTKIRLPSPGEDTQVELLDHCGIDALWKVAWLGAGRVGRKPLRGERCAEVEMDDVEVAEDAGQQPPSLQLADEPPIVVIPDDLVGGVAERRKA